MKIISKNDQSDISSEKLAEFESKHSIRLPEDYKEFLLTHNGGKPDPSCFNIKNDTSDVRIFYGLNNDGQYSVEVALKLYKNRLSRDIIPIGSDSFGNQICLGVMGESQNKIYFWNHEFEGTSKALTKVANSFSEFVDSLYEWSDPDETIIEKIVRNNDIEKLKLLLINGYDINKRDSEGISLIEDAVRLNRIEMVRLLVEHGADLGSSLEIAKKNLKFFPKFKEITEYLENLHSK